MYQRLTCQAQHVDPDFYAQYYPPGAVTDQHHSHFERWHPQMAGDDGKPPRRTGSDGAGSPGAGGGAPTPPGAL